MTLKPRDIICLSCDTHGVIADWEFCESYVCSNCGQIHRVVGVSVTKGGKINSQASYKPTPILPFGLEINWKNKIYQVCGFSLKADHENFTWHEYVAINHVGKYIHISYFNGHWNVIETYDEGLKKEIENSELLKVEFKNWNNYKARTVHSSGSFPYDASAWRSYKVDENVSPPYILITEKSEDTVTYLGTYVSPSSLRKIINKEIVLHYREGVGANQPFYKFLNPIDWWIGSIFLIIVLLVLNGFFNSNRNDELILKQSIFASDTSGNKPISTASFDIDHMYSTLKFTAISDLRNNWVELDLELVNEETNEARAFVLGLEYYSGVDDGYSWSEGTNSITRYLCSVAKGKYHMVIMPKRSNSKAPVNIDIKLYKDPPYYSNTLYLAGFVILISIILSVVKYFWDKSRWSNSPYSPYNHE